MLTKREKIDYLIRSAFGHSAFTQLRLQNPANSEIGTMEYLENDIKEFITKSDSFITDILN